MHELALLTRIPINPNIFGGNYTWATIGSSPGFRHVSHRQFASRSAKGFLDINHPAKQPLAGIIRLVNLSLRDQTAVYLHILQNHLSDLTAGAIVTAKSNQVRIRIPK